MEWILAIMLLSDSVQVTPIIILMWVNVFKLYFVENVDEFQSQILSCIMSCASATSQLCYKLCERMVIHICFFSKLIFEV